jgi:hypothetical protein
VGLRNIDPGNVVTANGTTGLCVITQIQPITVIFTIAEDEIDEVTAQMATGKSLQVLASTARSNASARHRHLAHRRQPGQHDHRHGARPGDLPEHPQRAVSESIREHAAAGQDLDRRRRSCRRRRFSATTTQAFVYVVQPDSTVKSTDIKIVATEGETSAVTGVDPRAISSSPTASTSCRTARRSSSASPRRRKPQAPARARKASSRGQGPDEPVPPVHPAADRHIAADGGDSADRHHRLPAAAHRGTAGSGLSDHAGADLLSRREPDVVATAITAPLERQLGEVPGLSQMLSTSSDGASVITLQFNLSLNIDVAEQDVQEAINAAQNYLPAAAADAAGVQQGQSRRRAHPHPRAHLGLHAAVSRSRTTPTRASRRRSRSCPASAP